MDSVFLFLTNINQKLFAFTYFLNILDILLLTIMCLIFWGFFINSAFKVKIIYFLFFIITIAIWGMWASLDIFILFLVLAEFFILFLFLIISWNVNLFNEKPFTPKFFFFKLYITTLLIYFLSVIFSTSTFVQQKYFLYWFFWDTYTNDLFIYFYFFFIDYPLIIIYITLILSIFSLLFVWFYFIMRGLQLRRTENLLSLNILREQKLVSQFKYKPKLTTFKK